MSKEILFTLAHDPTYDTTSTIGRLEGLQKKGFERYYNPGFLEEYINQTRCHGEDNFSFTWHPYNAPGQWMSNNISRPSKVITDPITLERTREELESERFEYLVISTHLSGYSTFREIAKHVREEYPKVKIIAASTGALIDESSQLADFTLRGSQVHDLRSIVDQPRNDPLKITTVQSDTETYYRGITKTGNYALLISSLGCINGCDFCPSTAQFGKEYITPFSAQEIKDSIISAHEKIAPKSNEFIVSVAEPQGLGNIKLWKEVLRLCRNLPFKCDLVTTTSSKIIEKYGLDELTMGDLSLSTVNIGVESLLQGYKKNAGVDLKALNQRLQAAGINVVLTYIIGLDWQTKDNIREEVKLLKDIGSSAYIVANLKMHPNTPLYKAYRKSGRLIDVPPELLNFYGYQSYVHPNFVAGFNDMLPLLGEIANELTDEGESFRTNLQIFMKRKNEKDLQKISTIKQMTENYRKSLDPRTYKENTSVIVDKFAAELYFHLIFRQMDLFHPFVIL